MDVPVVVALLVLLLGDSRLRGGTWECLRAGASLPVAAARWGYRHRGAASGHRSRRVGNRVTVTAQRLTANVGVRRPNTVAAERPAPAPSDAAGAAAIPQPDQRESAGAVRLAVGRRHAALGAARAQARATRHRSLFHDAGGASHPHRPWRARVDPGMLSGGVGGGTASTTL